MIIHVASFMLGYVSCISIVLLTVGISSLVGVVKRSLTARQARRQLRLDFPAVKVRRLRGG